MKKHSDMDWINKAQSEERPLSPEQEQVLDTLLESEAQAQISDLVRSMPAEEPEPAWRSELSARLHAVAAGRERKRRVLLVFRPALGLALAGALAFAFFFGRAPESAMPTSSPRVEEQVLNAHRESVHLTQFWGAIRADEDARTPAPATSEYRWEETDLSTF
jgi:hypothetical protein